MRHRTATGAIVLGLLLILVPVARATPVGPIEIATVLSGRAYNFDQPGNGFLRISGQFSSSAPLDLGASGVNATLAAILDEDNHGELVGGLPVALFPRTRSARVTVFETPVGAKPFFRLTVRTCIPTQETCPNTRGIDVGEYEFLIEGVGPTIASPTECGPPPGPGSTVITGLFTIDDGINPPVSVLYDFPWTCLFQKGRVIIIRRL